MTARSQTAACYVLLVAGLLAAGCTEKLKPPPNAPMGPTGSLFTPDSVQVIFDTNCLGCHSGGADAAAGQDLSPDSSYRMIVDHLSIKCAPLDRIEPFHPELSCLMGRITGRVTPRMPLGAAALSAADTTTIHNWIVAGAPGVLRAPTF